MESKKQEPPDQKPLIILFIIITICVVFVGLWYYSSQKNALISEKQLELSAIADLKIRQISQWRLERIGDGSYLGENILMLERFSDFFQNTSDVKLRSDILQSIR
jgi:hypothetical protein